MSDPVLIHQGAKLVPIRDASSEALLHAATHLGDLALVEPIRAEIARRGLKGGGFCAVKCTVCGAKALYRVGKDGYCKVHEPAARERLHLSKEAVR